MLFNSYIIRVFPEGVGNQLLRPSSNGLLSLLSVSLVVILRFIIIELNFYSLRRVTSPILTTSFPSSKRILSFHKYTPGGCRSLW